MQANYNRLILICFYNCFYISVFTVLGSQFVSRLTHQARNQEKEKEQEQEGKGGEGKGGRKKKGKGREGGREEVLPLLLILLVLKPLTSSLPPLR